MRLRPNGVEWGRDCYIYWFDWISNPLNRMFGYERIHHTHMICFWWFCISIKVRDD